jgi:RNA-directed DNA polymerase
VSCEVHARFCESRGVRFPSATHLVAAFKYHGDAVRFRRDMEERLAAFGLRVAPEKTALLCFDGNLLHGTGRPAVKPATFTFLGFTHFLTKARSGPVNIVRTPSVKARERFVRAVKDWLKANKHHSVWEQQAHLTKALNGYYQYFGLRLCVPKLNGVWWRVRRLWQRALARRSQRARRRCDFQSSDARPWFQLPRPTLTHAWV